MKRLRPNDQRAKVAIALILVVMITKIVLIISGYMQYNLITRAANGVVVSLQEANANDQRHILLAAISVLMLIVSSVTFIMWFRRAYYNLGTKSKYLEHSDGWAAGAWFVPIISWFRPYQIMHELYFETGQLLTRGGLRDKKDVNLVFVGIWWGLWVLANVSGLILRTYLRGGLTSLDKILFVTKWDMFNAILFIPLSILAIKVIKDYSKMEAKLPLLTEEDGIRPIIVSDNDILDSTF